MSNTIWTTTREKYFKEKEANEKKLDEETKQKILQYQKTKLNDSIKLIETYLKNFQNLNLQLNYLLDNDDKMKLKNMIDERFEGFEITWAINEKNVCRNTVISFK